MAGWLGWLAVQRAGWWLFRGGWWLFRGLAGGCLKSEIWNPESEIWNIKSEIWNLKSEIPHLRVQRNPNQRRQTQDPKGPSLLGKVFLASPNESKPKTPNPSSRTCESKGIQTKDAKPKIQRAPACWGKCFLRVQTNPNQRRQTQGPALASPKESKPKIPTQGLTKTLVRVTLV